MKLIIHTDGGARGNPGPAAVGVYIEEALSSDEPRSDRAEKKSKTLSAFGKKIGVATNNVAEYTAVIEALIWVNENIQNYSQTPISIQFYLDSTLVVNQLNGFFKVKEGHLRELLTSIRILEGATQHSIRYNSVPREQNAKADALVNWALDS